MPKPKLIFRSFYNSFVVRIPNLEALDVEQIQELQTFVTQRKGIFDFENYSFSIQKKLDFFEFTKLLQHLNINADCQEEFSTFREEKISFGQYKGMNFNELADSYIVWLAANYRGPQRASIDKEIKRRKL